MLGLKRLPLAKTTLTIGAVISLLLVGAMRTPVSADTNQSEITLSPTSTKLSLDPGSSHSGRIKVLNTGKDKLKVKVYVKPYQVKDSAYDPDFEADNGQTQIARWTTVDKPDFELAADENAEVNYTINVPKDVAAGGQYAVIFAEASGVDSDGSKDSIEIKKRVGTLLYATINGGSTRQAGQLKSFSAQKLLLSKPIKATFNVENSGNTDFAVDYKMTVTDNSGKNLLTRSGESTVLPSTNRDFNLEWSDQVKQASENNPPSFGVYKMKVDISFLGQTETREQTLFIVPIQALIIAVIVIGLIIGGIIYAFKRKRARKIKF